MHAIKFIYPYNLSNFDDRTTCFANLALLKAQYYFDKNFGDEGLKGLAY